MTCVRTVNEPIHKSRKAWRVNNVPSENAGVALLRFDVQYAMRFVIALRNHAGTVGVQRRPVLRPLAGYQFRFAENAQGDLSALEFLVAFVATR